MSKTLSNATSDFEDTFMGKRESVATCYYEHLYRPSKACRTFLQSVRIVLEYNMQIIVFDLLYRFYLQISHHFGCKSSFNELTVFHMGYIYEKFNLKLINLLINLFIN